MEKEGDFVGKYCVGMINILMMTLNKKLNVTFFSLCF